jgi:hypothetical protein
VQVENGGYGHGCDPGPAPHEWGLSVDVHGELLDAGSEADAKADHGLPPVPAEPVTAEAADDAPGGDQPRSYRGLGAGGRLGRVEVEAGGNLAPHDLIGVEDDADVVRGDAGRSAVVQVECEVPSGGGGPGRGVRA